MLYRTGQKIRHKNEKEWHEIVNFGKHVYILSNGKGLSEKMATDVPLKDIKIMVNCEAFNTFTARKLKMATEPQINRALKAVDDFTKAKYGLDAEVTIVVERKWGPEGEV